LVFSFDSSFEIIDSTSGCGLALALGAGAGGALRFRETPMPIATIAIAAAPTNATRAAGMFFSAIVNSVIFVAPVTSVRARLW
jgi:hypothetical protein